MAMIEVRDFTFAYPGSGAPALKRLSFSVGRGEMLLLCGKSGSGKTTLLQSLKKEIAPHGEASGRIEIEGLEGADPSERAKKVGYVRQEPEAQIVTDTVWHELAFGLENLGLAPEVIRRRVGETASFFGIEGWFEKSVQALSGGQKQILNLAAITAMQPDIILLDEPLAQLDPIASKEFIQMIARINTELGKTILLCEHHLDDVLSLCDRVLFLAGGEQKFLGTPADFAAHLLHTAGRAGSFCEALPEPARLALHLGEREALPLTVKDGRQWLHHFASSHSLHLAANPSLPGRPAPLLVAQDLWYRYPGGEPFALKGACYEVMEGRFHCIVGGNGSGKTTLLAALCGIVKPQRGRVKKSGQQTLGLLSQNPKTLFVRDTLYDDLRDAAGPEGGAALVKQAEALALEPLLGRHPYDLSAGEMQKAALAKLLLRNPDILLLDEPTKGIDASSRQEVGRILKNLQAAGATIVVVGHDLEFAAEHADVCSMMFDGGIIASGGRDFLAGNAFYTTGVNRMTRDLVAGCVRITDLFPL